MPFDIETAVRERYGAAANNREVALCCPVEYNPEFLQVLPSEIIERDYGCGDPSKFVKTGKRFWILVQVAARFVTSHRRLSARLGESLVLTQMKK